ncbi:MAG: phytanoyl-CoA dioxygenase family protein [Acidiferrobacterales bacterium]|nr:phytanoyl-CoA dioxygenase family protein [Acidiferrobacterales bacterium]
MNTTSILSPAEKQHYQEHGYLVRKCAVEENLLIELDEEIDQWIELCKKHDRNFGTTVDGKARFDLETGHTRENPRLRRVANPADISENFQKVLWNSPIIDMVAELIGPSITFHHCKLNTKFPGMETIVHYHQDHSYDPHTNDDMLAIVLMLDDTTSKNGCLRIVPGSHKHRYSHFKDGVYVGAIDESHNPQFDRESVPIAANRGDICFMHCWAVHGSQSNQSDLPRRLLICDYTAADSYPLLPAALPSKFTGKLLRGEVSRTARLRKDKIEIRTPYAQDSFFDVQELQFTTRSQASQ